MKILNPPNLFESRKNIHAICSLEEFREIIDRERDRAYRYNQTLSLAVFEVGTSYGNSEDVRRLIDAVGRRFRTIDRIGWYSNSQVGFILPYTSASGARKLAENISSSLASILLTPTFTIFSYPSKNWSYRIPQKIWGFLRLFSHQRQLTKSHAIYSEEEFIAVLNRERERADRNGHIFSLVVFNMSVLGTDFYSAEDFVRELKLRLRGTDEIGWLDKQRIGVIIPHTSQRDARSMAENFCKQVFIEVSDIYTVFTYPTNWYFNDMDGSASYNFTRVLNRTEIPVTGNTKSSSGAAIVEKPPPDGDHCTEPLQSSRMHVLNKESFFICPIPWWKRSMDIIVSLIGLILLSPLFLLIAVSMKLFSPGPVLFRQGRSGFGGKPFIFYKFRSMVVDAESKKKELLEFNERTGPAFKMTDDPRVTRIGKFIRRWSLDELPQLYNVLIGDMSLVGPRPLPVNEDRCVEQWHMIRRNIRPGITCLWQVSARDKSSFDDWVRLDIEYARKQSLALDLKILFMTLLAVISRKGAL